MDNSSYRSQYIQERVAAADLTEESAKEMTNLFERIGRYEDQLGKHIEDDLTREDFVFLFENIRIASIYSFKNIKSKFVTYLEWLRDKNYASPNLEALSGIKFKDISLKQVFEQKYFKDFQSLQDKINDTLWAAERIDDMVFATQITAIYLAWCGVKVEEAVALKKADVGEDHISVGGRKIYPNATIMSFIRDYRDAVSYEAQARGVINLKYIPSEYLLRTVRKDSITPKDLSFLLAKFSKSAADQNVQSDGNTFAYAKIYWSGVFHRAYIYECENGTIKKNDIATINRVFGENHDLTVRANFRLSDYTAFKEHFFPGAKH